MLLRQESRLRRVAPVQGCNDHFPRSDHRPSPRLNRIDCFLNRSLKVGGGAAIMRTGAIDARQRAAHFRAQEHRVSIMRGQQLNGLFTEQLLEEVIDRNVSMSGIPCGREAAFEYRVQRGTDDHSYGRRVKRYSGWHCPDRFLAASLTHAISHPERDRQPLSSSPRRRLRAL